VIRLGLQNQRKKESKKVYKGRKDRKKERGAVILPTKERKKERGKQK